MTTTRISPNRLLEVLEWDGGWLTSAGIQLLLPDMSEMAIDRALWRLRAKGLVEHRQVELARSVAPSNLWKEPVGRKLETRAEWRTL